MTRTAAMEAARSGQDLIPGDAQGMWSDAAALAVRGEAFADLAPAVGRVDTPTWTGSAAEAFFGSRDALRTKVQVAADCLLKASEALQQHAGVLAWAQRRASEALERYRAAAACVPPAAMANGLRDLSPDTAAQGMAREEVESLRRAVLKSARDTARLLNEAASYGPFDAAPPTTALGMLIGWEPNPSPWSGQGFTEATVTPPGAAAVAGAGVRAAGAAARAAAAEAAEATALQVPRATLGTSTRLDYRETFFQAYPELRGTGLWVHHAIEKQVLKYYPDLVTTSQMHSLENLRGIPKTINSDIHLSRIRIEWNDFYERHPPGTATLDDFLDFATRIDDMFGSQFTPPVRP